MKTILQNQANQFDTLQKNRSMSADDKKAKGRDIRADTLVQVRAILTPDQQQAFDDLHLKASRRSRSAGIRRKAAGGLVDRRRRQSGRQKVNDQDRQQVSGAGHQKHRSVIVVGQLQDEAHEGAEEHHSHRPAERPDPGD